jgi:hypothetical protein
MLPYYVWTLRLWCFDFSWKRAGLWKLHVTFLSRKRYVGKYRFAFFNNRRMLKGEK